MSGTVDLYQQKPAKAEAAQVPPAGYEYAAQGKELTDWLTANKVEYGVHPDATGYLRGLDCGIAAKPGDFIVRDSSGCFRVMPLEAFRREFEEVSPIVMLMNQVRPIIQRVALRAEQKMAEHDPKKGDSWVGCDIKFLEDKLIEEVEEYFQKDSHPSCRAMELADIVAVCAMLYARLTNGKKPQENSQ